MPKRKIQPDVPDFITDEIPRHYVASVETEGRGTDLDNNLMCSHLWWKEETEWSDGNVHTAYLCEHCGEEHHYWTNIEL